MLSQRLPVEGCLVQSDSFENPLLSNRILDKHRAENLLQGGGLDAEQLAAPLPGDVVGDYLGGVGGRTFFEL